VLREPGGQFIVVLKRGNHVPNVANYPKGRGTWYPAYDGNVAPESRLEAIVNTYDNGLAYNLDSIFKALFEPDGTLQRTTLLYTSDHGEVVSDEGALFSRGLEWSVLAVPMLMMGDARPPVDARYQAGHHNVFPTVLDLLGVPAAARPGAYGRSLLSAKASDRDRRIGFTGELTFGDGYQLADFDAIARPAILQ
jgi:lipid A ethanolaminephosphotransferase